MFKKNLFSGNEKADPSSIFDESYNDKNTLPPFLELIKQTAKSAFTKKNFKRLFKKLYRISRGVLATVANIFFSLFLSIIVTGCVTAICLTVYVMEFADAAADVTLTATDLTFSSYFYRPTKAGEYLTDSKDAAELDEHGLPYTIQLSTDENRVWINIDDMPQELIDAVVAVEDRRFFEHEGVDWWRTFGVVTNAMIKGDMSAGASTITQQLVRDVTKDNKVDVGRKLREIFAGLKLENKYTKYKILESYLNRISFGGTSYGVGSACQNYYGETIQDMGIIRDANGNPISDNRIEKIAKSALLSGIIRSPSNYNPYSSVSKAKERQVYALDCMYEYGYITHDEWEQALALNIYFRRPVKADDFGDDPRYEQLYGDATLADEITEEQVLEYENTNLTSSLRIQLDWDNLPLYRKKEVIAERNLYYADIPDSEIREWEPYKWNGDYKVTQNWYTDAAIKQVASDLAAKMGYTYEQALKEIYAGGYKIYSNENIEMQAKIEEVFKNPDNFIRGSGYYASKEKEDLLQAAFVLMDYSGNVLAVAGGIGEKEGINGFSRASDSLRSIGSTTKPISVYGPALDLNIITYSTMIQDISGEINSEKRPGEKDRWPQNYQRHDNGTGMYYPAWYAVQKSTNTIAVQVLQRIGIKTAYDQLTKRLGFSTLDPVNDMAYSPLSLGALTNGAKLTEVTAAFAIYGNGGMYYKPYFYTKVEDSKGKIVLEKEDYANQAVGGDSAYIMNRMMKKVVDDTSGTGRLAKIDNVEVVGKTGTSNDYSNLTFAALTNQYVGVYRVGYDDSTPIDSNQNIDGWETPSRVWKTVMESVLPESYLSANGGQMFQPSDFNLLDGDIVTPNYCSETGLLASSSCPDTAVGYYKKDYVPAVCNSSHNGTYWYDKGINTISFYPT